MQEVPEGGDPADHQPDAFRRISADEAERHHVDDQQHEEEAEQRTEAAALHRRAVEPGQHEEHRDGAEHGDRSEEHTSELQSLMRISYAVFRLKKKKKQT